MFEQKPIGWSVGWSRQPIWQMTDEQSRYPALTSDLSVDVVIIGGGITGLTTAAQLTRNGHRVALLEAARIGSGTTGHSTGNLYAPVDVTLHQLRKKWGMDRTRAVVSSRRLALEQVEKNIVEYRLECDFMRQPWALYSSQGLPEELEEIEREYQIALDCGLPAHISGDLPLPYPVKKAVIIENQLQLNPLRYVQQLAGALHSAGCALHEDSAVSEIDEDQGIVRTASATVRANKIVMATHTPKGFSLLHTELAPYREYAVAALLRERQMPQGIFWNAGAPQDSLRLVEVYGRAYALMIGEKHKTGQCDDSEAGTRRLDQLLRSRFNVRSIAFQWSAQHYRAADGLPYIGQVSNASPLYVATGFATDGLTYGTLAGYLLADLIDGRANEFADLYSPRRFTPLKSAKNFVRENLNVASFYVKDYVHGTAAKKLAALAPGHGEMLEVGGDKIAAYRDESGHLSLLSPVCTHLKCIVHWNNAEKSWDCPCHGSRFTTDGRVIEGPAMEPLRPYDGSRNDGIHH